MIEIGDGTNPVQRIKEVADNLRYLNTINDHEDVHFKKCGFVRPMSVVPLAIIGRQKNLHFVNPTSYLDTIEFPGGQEISEFNSSGATYFPITRAELRGLNDDQCEEKLRDLINKYPQLLERNIKDRDFLEKIGRNTTNHILSEMVTNIIEHAQAEQAYIFSQYWPHSKSCEICLADDGKGIYQSLLDAGRDVNSNSDAIGRVIKRGLSSKDDFGDQHRGTGIKNTINLLTNKELNGFFCVISGKHGYFVSSREKGFIFKLRNLNWNGTIVNMGFENPPKKINIYDYVR